MNNSSDEPPQEKHEEEAAVESAPSLEELDIPDDLKRELLHELEGLKESH